MTDLTLTKIQLRAGVWEGVLTGPTSKEPVLALRHNGDILPGLEVTADEPGQWHVRAPVPLELISDDLQSFVIVESDSDTILAQFVILAGEQIETNMRAEIDLLRAELDLLKRAFRRHCDETS